MKFDTELFSDTILFEELKLADYKQLLKCTFGSEPNIKVFVNTLVEVLSKTTSLSKDFFLLNCSVVDILLLLIKIKINSHEESCNLIVTKNDKQMNLEFMFDHLYEDIKFWYKPFLNKKLTEDNIEIIFDAPTLKILLEPTTEEILYFLKGCKILNKSKDFLAPQTIKESSLLLESLPPKLASQFFTHFNSFVKEIKTKNLLQRYPVEVDQQLMFLPSIDSLIWFTKLLFNEQLDTFYDNLFYLTKLGHFSTDYIENCTPGEYSYFVKKLEFSLAQQRAEEQNSEEEKL